MFNESLDLAQEFPEFKQAIHNLKERDAHFLRRFNEFEEARKELHRIAEEIETPSDEYTEELKKKLLGLKDELYSMLKKAA